MIRQRAIHRLYGLLRSPLFTIVDDAKHATALMKESIDDYKNAKVLRDCKRELRQLGNELLSLDAERARATWCSSCNMRAPSHCEAGPQCKAQSSGKDLSGIFRRRVIVKKRINYLRDEIVRLTPRGLAQ